MAGRKKKGEKSRLSQGYHFTTSHPLVREYLDSLPEEANLSAEITRLLVEGLTLRIENIEAEQKRHVEEIARLEMMKSRAMGRELDERKGLEAVADQEYPGWIRDGRWSNPEIQNITFLSSRVPPEDAPKVLRIMIERATREGYFARQIPRNIRRDA